MNIAQCIADDIAAKPAQVESVITLLAEGATVPFIARYRKEVTGGLTDTQLRTLVERLQYLTELQERRATILKSIEEQGKLTKELKLALDTADNKTTLEDLYLPYKPKRRTKAQIAREAGLEPLATALLEHPQLDPTSEALKYIDESKSVIDAKAALEGARHILMEMFAERADLLAELRQYLNQHGILFSKVIKDQEEAGIKFSDYFDYSQALNKIPSHRALALFRGQKLGFLNLHLGFADDSYVTHCYQLIASRAHIKVQQRPADSWLWQTVEWTWKIKFHTKLELELLGVAREHAEEDAIKVFKDNLKNLLMSAPAGNRIVMGLDPGLRTGVKVVVIDGTGKLLEYTTIFPHVPRNQWNEALITLAKLSKTHHVNLISIGNGTASRETERLVSELISKMPDLPITKAVVSEAGASVYSASQIAANEFPELDVSFRGAVSIARRLQDPLAELVKIDPKAIGVGQYQHDVNQVKLGRSLFSVVEDCVNAVGADVNTASVPLLTSISGLNETIAKNIVAWREQQGRFHNREEIKQVPRLGKKTYEQAIGFLRIVGGDNPLDASAVHPESYPLVDQILQYVGKPINQLMGHEDIIDQLTPQQFITDTFGLPTVKDILQELKKPGRDPRPEFRTVEFREGVETINQLKTGMVLSGVVTNVANFGAFVDIGVHQDGLVHISAVAERFVADIHEVLKVGQIVSVKVLEIDLPRKRISLTMRLDAAASANQPPEKVAVKQPVSKVKHKVVPEKELSLLASQLTQALKKK